MFRLLNYILFEKEIQELKSMKMSDKSVTLKLLAFFFYSGVFFSFLCKNIHMCLSSNITLSKINSLTSYKRNISIDWYTWYMKKYHLRNLFFSNKFNFDKVDEQSDWQGFDRSLSLDMWMRMWTRFFFQMYKWQVMDEIFIN